MKKILSLLMIVIMTAALAAGCNSNLPPAPPTDTSPSPPPDPSTPSTPPPQTPTSPSGGTETAGPEDETPDPEPVRPGPIMISAEEVQAMIGDPNLVLIGVINPTAALVPFSNAANPIRGSYLIWTDELYGPCPEALSPDLAFGRLPLGQMEALLSRAGVTDDSVLVVYASDYPSVGARAAWHLSVLGLNVRFLDGGVSAWRAINGRTGASSRLTGAAVQNDFKATNYDPSFCYASIDMVIEALQNPSEWVVIDTRADDEYSGDRSGAGAYGSGRMKGAVHIEWTNNNNSDEMLLPEAELRELYSFIGDRKVIAYCQGGVRSSYTWIVLRDLGYDVWNYDGSWIEWSYAASSASSYAKKDVVLGLTELWTDNNGPF